VGQKVNFSFQIKCYSFILFIDLFASNTPAQFSNLILANTPRLLVISKVATGQYVHDAIPISAQTMMELGKESGFLVDTTSDSTTFNSQNLDKYQAVCFNHVIGSILDSNGEKAFKDFIHKGRGFVGIHASSYAELKWLWYKNLVGAYFVSHSEWLDAKMHVVDSTNLATKSLPRVWPIYEEWYNFDRNPKDSIQKPEDSVHVLINLDEKSYKGGTMGADHPYSWYHIFEGGRSWYTALGHMKAMYGDTNFRNHLRGGLLYALGMAAPTTLIGKDNKPIRSNFSVIKSNQYLINGKLIFHSKERRP